MFSHREEKIVARSALPTSFLCIRINKLLLLFIFFFNQNRIPSISSNPPIRLGHLAALISQISPPFSKIQWMHLGNKKKANLKIKLD